MLYATSASHQDAGRHTKNPPLPQTHAPRTPLSQHSQTRTHTRCSRTLPNETQNRRTATTVTAAAHCSIGSSTTGAAASASMGVASPSAAAAASGAASATAAAGCGAGASFLGGGLLAMGLHTRSTTSRFLWMSAVVSTGSSYLCNCAECCRQAGRQQRSHNRVTRGQLQWQEEHSARAHIAGAAVTAAWGWG